MKFPFSQWRPAILAMRLLLAASLTYLCLAPRGGDVSALVGPDSHRSNCVCFTGAYSAAAGRRAVALRRSESFSRHAPKPRSGAANPSSMMPLSLLFTPEKRGTYGC